MPTPIRDRISIADDIMPNDTSNRWIEATKCSEVQGNHKHLHNEYEAIHTMVGNAAFKRLPPLKKRGR
jgi:hypothetical protein